MSDDTSSSSAPDDASDAATTPHDTWHAAPQAEHTVTEAVFDESEQVSSAEVPENADVPAYGEKVELDAEAPSFVDTASLYAAALQAQQRFAEGKAAGLLADQLDALHEEARHAREIYVQAERDMLAARKDEKKKKHANKPKWLQEILAFDPFDPSWKALAVILGLSGVALVVGLWLVVPLLIAS